MLRAGKTEAKILYSGRLQLAGEMLLIVLLLDGHDARELNSCTCIVL